MTYQGIDVLNILSDAVNYNNALIKICLKYLSTDCTKIVDFGAGTGTCTEIFKDKGYEIECVEKDEVLSSTLKNKGFKVCMSIDSYADNSIQNVVSFNVFEHIENDCKAFSEIYKKLNTDGKFFLFLPAFSFLYSSFDKRLGHYRRYDKDKLETMLKNCGYKIETSFYFDSLGFLFAYIYKLTNKKGTISKFHIKIYDKFFFPVSMALDKLFSKHFGKNVVFVLSKK